MMKTPGICKTTLMAEQASTAIHAESAPTQQNTMKNPLAIFAAATFVAHPGWAEDRYPVVDSGQLLTYDARHAIPAPKAGDPYYGQDAQYTANAPTYKIQWQRHRIGPRDRPDVAAGPRRKEVF